MNEIPAWAAALMSVASALVVALISKWYDKHVESTFSSKKRVSETELAVAVEKAKTAGTAEGYLWKRIEVLEGSCESLRSENNELRAKYTKALDDLDDASRSSAALAIQVEDLQSKVANCHEENLTLIRRIIRLENGNGKKSAV